MKKVVLTETLFLKKKDKTHQKQNLTVHLLELILHLLENYDADYEASRRQTFISNFNKNKVKEIEDKIKNLSVKNNVKDK